jgi:hypothetical protein
MEETYYANGTLKEREIDAQCGTVKASYDSDKSTKCKVSEKKSYIWSYKTQSLYKFIGNMTYDGSVVAPWDNKTYYRLSYGTKYIYYNTTTRQIAWLAKNKTTSYKLLKFTIGLKSAALRFEDFSVSYCSSSYQPYLASNLIIRIPENF